VIQYVNNIRDGLIQLDPAGRDSFNQNAAAYIQELQDLDQWITSRVSEIPSAKRLLVTNHDTLGYFADRYGFKIIGSVIPSLSTDATPTARDIAALEDQIKAAGVKAIFMEVEANNQLALQISQDTSVKVIDTLYTHSLTTSAGPAPSYLDMMRYDVSLIVDALK